MLTIKIEGREYDLPQGITVIGRGEDADITIDSTKLSRTHVRFYITADKIEIEDLGSKNGTFVNARRIEGKKELIKGDRVKLADIECMIVFPKSPAQPASPSTLSKPSSDKRRLSRKDKALIQRIVICAVLVIIGLIVYSPIKNYLTKDQQEAQRLVKQADGELSSITISEDIKTNNEVKGKLEILKKRLSEIPTKYEEEYDAAGKLIAEIDKELNRIQAKNRELRTMQDVSAQYADIVKELDTGSLSHIQAISRLEHLISMYPGTESADKAGTKINEINRIILKEEQKELENAKAKARVLTVSLQFREALLVINENLVREYVRISRKEVDTLNRIKKEILRKAEEYFRMLADTAINKARTGDCAQLKAELETQYEIIGLAELETIFIETAKRIDEINAERIAHAKKKLKKELKEIETFEKKRMYEKIGALYERLIPGITEPELKKEIEKRKLVNDLYAIAKKNIIRFVHEANGIEIAAFGHIKSMNEHTIELQMEDRSMPIGWDKIRDGEFLMLASMAVSKYSDVKLYVAYAVLLLEKDIAYKADRYLSKALSSSESIRSLYPGIFAEYQKRDKKRTEEKAKHLAELEAAKKNSLKKKGPLPAFPGAEGYGSATPGGRGGRVIKVINLNPSGAGSFREACNANGPRIIVFCIGGIIDLKEAINIRNPFVTIAGQTAPGDGICIKGAGIGVATHDVIIRGLRLRIGDGPDGPPGDVRDGMEVGNEDDPPYNVIFDHCSISWAIDENLSCWYLCHDVTFQWCIISEALNKSLHTKGGHSKGVLIGDHASRISIHHCLFAHNVERNPRFKGDTDGEIINNLIYNWTTFPTDLGGLTNEGSVICNIIGNYYKPGKRRAGSGKSVIIRSSSGPDTKIYVKDNLGPGRPTGGGDDWHIVSGDKKFRSLTPALEPSGITIHKVKQVYELVLRYAGATVPKRDAVDERIIKSVRDGTGEIIDSQDEVGGWPEYNNGILPSDSDHDGIPDEWEIKRGLNPTSSRDAHVRSSSGYTYFEEYINSLIPMP